MKASDETRALQRAIKVGVKQKPEHVQIRIDPLLGRKRPSEVGAKISASKTGKMATDKTRAILRDANRSREPEVRARIKVGMARARWEHDFVPSAFAQWGDGASAGLV